MKGLNAMSADLSKAVTADLAKDDFSNWLFEVRMLEREIEHGLKHLKGWMKDECVDTPLMLGPAKSYLQKEPLGVVAVLGSWNYPLATALGPVISAILAGNCVILKPSEMAPYTAKAVKTLFARFLDLSAYQCINGGVNVAIRTTSSKVDLIIFTGSTEKGKLVAGAAAKNLVPCILELGGKCPMIIDESCDLAYSCKKAAAMGFLNSG
jgi:aldehyde dehydrogenase (NAD+)